MNRKGMTFADLDELQQTQRHDEMASLAMAYVFYQTGQLKLAAKYFNRIPQDSPYWLDGIFGKAWTEFLAAYRDLDNENLHYQRSLGHIHTLRAPFFPYRLYPETPLLEAEIFYFNCQYRLAALALEEFDRRYADVGHALAKLLKDYPEDFGLYQLDHDLQGGKSPVGEKLTRVLEGLLDNKRLDQKRSLVTKFEAERKSLEEMTPAFRNGALGERIEEDIDLAVSGSREAAGQAVRQRLQAAVREIKTLRAQRNQDPLRTRTQTRHHHRPPARRANAPNPTANTNSTSTTVSTGKTNSASTTTRSPTSAASDPARPPGGATKRAGSGTASRGTVAGCPGWGGGDFQRNRVAPGLLQGGRWRSGTGSCRVGWSWIGSAMARVRGRQRPHRRLRTRHPSSLRGERRRGRPRASVRGSSCSSCCW